MRAVTVERYGGIDAMQMTNSLLRPTEPGPTEVIVRVYAAALNPVDVNHREGKLKALLHDSFPFIPGEQPEHT
jgi:NADPH:quinone reductase